MAARSAAARRHVLVLVDAASPSEPLRAAVLDTLRHHCACADSIESDPHQPLLEHFFSLLVAKEQGTGWIRKRDLAELLDVRHGETEYFTEPWDGGDILDLLEGIAWHQALDIIWAFDGSIPPHS